jgi:hypothetical protein
MRKYKRQIEGISSNEDSIVFDYSNSDGIRVSFGTKQVKYSPYKTTVENNTIFSLYQVDSNDKHILRALKGESNLKADKKNLDYFANRSALYAFQLIPSEIDLILYSENSYYLFDTFIKQLQSKFSSKKLKVSQSIYKTNTSNLFIKELTPDKYRKDLDRLLVSLQKKDTIKLRNDIPLKFRKYFSGYISIRDELQKDISGKNVLIIDDILTSGSTFIELFNILKLRNANNIYGLTLFKFKK